MKELLAILIPGAVAIGVPFVIAKVAKIRLFSKDDGYTAGWCEGFIMGNEDNNY